MATHCVTVIPREGARSSHWEISHCRWSCLMSDVVNLNLRIRRRLSPPTLRNSWIAARCPPPHRLVVHGRSRSAIPIIATHIPMATWRYHVDESTISARGHACRILHACDKVWCDLVWNMFLQARLRAHKHLSRAATATGEKFDDFFLSPPKGSWHVKLEWMTTAHNGQANRECMSISFAIGKLNNISRNVSN